jgi:uncharacterized protein YebE (UPF0316 family)
MQLTLTLTPEAIGMALLIFVLRVFNNGLGTVRLIVMARQQRMLTAVLGFFEALTFAVTIAVVAADLSDMLNLFAYCIGFAAGSWVGMAIEARFIVSYVVVHIITRMAGGGVAKALRDSGFGVTEIDAQGREGQVAMLHVVTQRREVPRVRQIAESADPAAFISVEEARSVARGWHRRDAMV